MKKQNALLIILLITVAAMAALTAQAAIDTSLCENDCTFTYDEICHAECHNVNGCSFIRRLPPPPPPSQFPRGDAARFCDNAHKGFLRRWDTQLQGQMLPQYVRCCEGNYTGWSPTYSTPAVVQINGTNVVRVTRLVWLDGRPTMMIINVFSLK